MVSRYTCPFYWKLLQQVTRIGLPFASAAGASALACKQPNLEKRDQKRFNKDHISCIDHSQLTWKARHFSLLVSRAWKSGLCSGRSFSCLHETSATTFTQDLNWNCATIWLSPWTHQCIRNLASQVLAIRFAVYFLAPNQSSTGSCQMLSIRCLSSRSLLWRLCLCLPKRTRLAHSKEIRWQLWPYCTKNMLKPTRGTKNTSTSNQTEKVVLSSCVKLCQFSFASFNVTAVVCYSGLSWCSRCLGCLQNNMVLRSSETFMGFKSESLSLQSKITGHNPWGTFLSEKKT